MPKTLPNQDIKYQPEVSGFSYSTKPKPKNAKEILSTFFTLLVAILGFLFLFLVILGILNYFKIISLIPYAPKVTEKLPIAPSPFPTPTYDQKTKTYTIEGTLYGYSEYIIEVKYYNRIIRFKFDPNKSLYYIQIAEDNTIAGIFSDFEKKQNIGKKVELIYFKDPKNNNIIQQITLYE